MLYTSQRSYRTRLKLGAVVIVSLVVLALSTLAAAGPPRQFGGTPTISIESEVGVEDGFIPDGETLSPFDRNQPALENLDLDLLAAIQEATTDAKADGIEVVITSGWRSKHYQQQLLDEAVVTYGSLEIAREWVNTPEKSTHVSGDAVDVGYTDADYWLIQYGSEYGLCQTYANEIWHFELMVEPGDVCPSPLEDASVR